MQKVFIIKKIYIYTSRPAELMGRGRGSKESCAHALKREEASKNLHTQSIKEEYMYLFGGSLTRFFFVALLFFL